jgi:hypothetical protein
MTKPIILSKDELRAALSGTLTEVRRKVKPQPVGNQRVVEGLAHYTVGMNPADDGAVWYVADGIHPGVEVRPYPTGTRLWVKETWCLKYDADDEMVYNAAGDIDHTCCWYRATTPGVVMCAGLGLPDRKDGRERSPWQSSPSMPIWASRLTLTVESVAVSNDGGEWWWVYGVNVERKDAR